MRLLFVCGRNRIRSPTAEQIFAGVCGVEVRSAGVSPDAEEQLSTDVIEWADVIFVMEALHRKKMARQFASSLRGKRVVCLGIPDDFGFMDERLIQILWDRVPRSVTVLVGAKPADQGSPSRRGGT
jgi:predicted protein tyrosine phosphatase